MVVINQDCDKVLKLKESKKLICAPVYFQGTYCGYNLYANDELLGTYDNAREAFEEMARLKACTQQIFKVH